MGVGFDYDINSLYPHQVGMLKALRFWKCEFSWKPRKSATSGKLIWLKRAYREIGTNTWMDSTDYIMHKLSQE
jgi:hypothetical protein